MSRKNTLAAKKINRVAREIKRKKAKATIPTIPSFYIPGYANLLYLESRGLIKEPDNEKTIIVKEADIKEIK